MKESETEWQMVQAQIFHVTQPGEVVIKLLPLVELWPHPGRSSTVAKWPVAGVMAPMMNLWWRTAVWCSLLELRNKCHFYDPCETVARFGWRPLVWCVVWVSHRMLRVSVLLGAFLSPASSWWFTNNTKPEDPGPWHMWLQDHSPYLHEYVLAAENGFDRFAQEHYVELPRFDAGLWLVIDTLVGLVGWAIFGSAWNEVRLGCQRVFQFTALILWHVQT